MARAALLFASGSPPGWPSYPPASQESARQGSSWGQPYNL